jgi:hypothetical protein
MAPPVAVYGRMMKAISLLVPESVDPSVSTQRSIREENEC